MAWATHAFTSLPFPVSGAAFDPVEERLWAADTDGFLSSLAVPSLSVLTRTRAAWVTNYDDAAWAVTAFRGHGMAPVVSAR